MSDVKKLTIEELLALANEEFIQEEPTSLEYNPSAEVPQLPAHTRHGLRESRERFTMLYKGEPVARALALPENPFPTDGISHTIFDEIGIDFCTTFRIKPGVTHKVHANVLFALFKYWANELQEDYRAEYFLYAHPKQKFYEFVEKYFPVGMTDNTVKRYITHTPSGNRRAFKRTFPVGIDLSEAYVTYPQLLSIHQPKLTKKELHNAMKFKNDHLLRLAEKRRERAEKRKQRKEEVLKKRRAWGEHLRTLKAEKAKNES